MMVLMMDRRRCGGYLWVSVDFVAASSRVLRFRGIHLLSVCERETRVIFMDPGRVDREKY